MPSTQSERTVADGEAKMGVATTRDFERVAAALGVIDKADLQFEVADDVPNGGVLCALPALLNLGLLHHSHLFTYPKGFYPFESIFILLSFLALGRVPSLEQLRYQTPGDWGKLLGLDRIPEVKTLREKISLLGDDAALTARWSGALANDWMEHDVQSAGVLLIDGHVRPYYGNLTDLPHHYISREKLCLRATTDYWVNALDGQPFFCVTKPIDPGLQQTLENDIIPRLLNDVPGQPTLEMLTVNPKLHRFILIFDREGYSPDLFLRLKQQRIAILCYHKFQKEDWPLLEFRPCQITYVSGETEEVMLAERGTCLRNGLWVRELRHLDKSGHQTSILSTDYQSDLERQAASMFSRWHQENFFKYMRNHYGLDKLVEYGVSPLPETTRLINPAWRALESQVRSLTGKLNRARALLGSVLHHADNNTEAVGRYERRKGALLEIIIMQEKQLDDLKRQRKSHSKHIQLKDLPEEQRIAQLRSGRKHFIDTIKLISYRAESMLVSIAREKLKRHDDARSFIRSLMQTSVNLRPDIENEQLTVELHGQANAMHDSVVTHICDELNEISTVYPGTKLRLRYVNLRSASFP